MKRYMGIGPAVCVGLAALLLGGCTGADTQGASQGLSRGTVLSMESTPVIDYTLPHLTPNILVDSIGYEAGREKEAAVKGKELPETFWLYDAETGEAVYRGTIEEESCDQELGLYMGYADFSEYTGEGTYYLECQGIGRSYSFSIQKNLYGQLYEELSQEILARCTENTAQVWEVMELLTACEWYPQLLTDADENQIPDTLEEIGLWIQTVEEAEAFEENDALYAALLAKFSYVYQKYDRTFATQCLQKASQVFEKAQSTLQKDTEIFFALTELFRATGLSTYGKQIRDYRTYFENNTSYLEEEEYLYGSMTYLSTRQKVDRELCSIFMEKLMDRGEEISVRCEEIIHPLEARNNGAGQLLNQAGQLSCANYVLNNYQYTSVIEKFLHYLMGENLESVCFYSPKEAQSGYLLLFAQLAATADITEGQTIDE